MIIEKSKNSLFWNLLLTYKKKSCPFSFVQFVFLGHVECGHRLPNGMVSRESDEVKACNYASLIVCSFDCFQGNQF